VQENRAVYELAKFASAIFAVFQIKALGYQWLRLRVASKYYSLRRR
jgi:hypothetical protein